MIDIVIPGRELFNEETLEFSELKPTRLRLEHSLVSLSKWEAIWKKPFLSDKDKTSEESLSYIRCMTVTQNVNPDVYPFIPKDEMDRIADYIQDSMTAATFHVRNQGKGKTSRETTTAETIYYWMISLGIPFECEKWHLNRLLNLIRFVSIKNAPQKKMSRREVMDMNRSINEARLKQLHTTG